MVHEPYLIPEGFEIVAEDGGEAKKGTVLARGPEGEEITAQKAGRVRVEGRKVIISREEKEVVETEIPSAARLVVKDGEHVEAGQPITEGSLNPHKILRIQGREAAQLYLLSEVQQVYRSQGQNIHDKHFEIIIRQMLSRVKITYPGDSGYLPGDLVSRIRLLHLNEKLRAEGKRPAKFKEVLLGITKAALNTDSFLSAASFQHTIRVLAESAIAGKEDPLVGLKENVILGKLIPAGTGFSPERFAKVMQLEEDESEAEPPAETGADDGHTENPAPAPPLAEMPLAGPAEEETPAETLPPASD